MARFMRVGGTQELRVNVRLIAATNRDIIEAIRQDQFREDLFHRLNVVQFRLPPLRERGDDVPLLAEHFLRGFGVSMNKNTRRLLPRGAAEAAVPPLAGQRAGAAQRDRTRADPGDQPARFSPPACRISSSKAACTKPSRPNSTAPSRSTTRMADFERELITPCSSKTTSA